MFAAKVSTAAEYNKGHKEYSVGHIISPYVELNKCLDFFHKGKDGHKGECNEQLDSQHQEHLEAIVDC